MSIAEFARVVVGYAPVVLSGECKERVEKSHALLKEVLARDEVVYGVNTGFGKLSTVALKTDQRQELQRNLLRSHACGVGDPFPEDVVRGMMLLRVLSLVRGYSGVRPRVVEVLLQCLNAGVHPVVPEQGSLGASGDLAPLAHLALVLIGEGEAWYAGERLSGAQALSRASIEPLTLAEKEGLALINGTQAMTSVGILAWLRARTLLESANGIAALTIQALEGIADALSEKVQSIRPYPEQTYVAKQMRTYLNGSKLVVAPSPQKVQDAYSLRCVPQVHGASLRALRHVGQTLAIEMNSVTDNPVLFADSGQVCSGGNFHGQPIALAMDYMKVAVCELANISERRTERLVNPQLNGGLPAFLTSTPGVSSGLMILQYTAASLVSENKVLAHPASVDSIPSSGNQEDHVSMGTTAARQASKIVEHTAKVLAIELICAAEALGWKGKDRVSGTGMRVIDWLRAFVPPYVEDRGYSSDIEKVAVRIMSGQFTDVLREEGATQNP